MPDDTSATGAQLLLSTWLGRLFPGRGDEQAGRQGIAEFLSECRSRGLLEPDEFAMLEGVLEVSETHVREIMIPRSRMVVIPQNESADAVLKIIVESGHSRFPVIGADRDEIVRILLAKDVLKQYLENAAAFAIDALLRPAVFVPESKRLSTLLKDFRESHQHLAVVVDEYGGISGLATIEDVLEQIVGNIDDEHDPEEVQPIQEMAEGRYQVMGLTRIESFNEYFGSELDDEEYETIGGLIMHELGRLPRRGEKLRFGEFEFQVSRADRRRIHTAEVSRPNSATEVVDG
jgi:magnesium and cobalt transporter